MNRQIPMYTRKDYSIIALAESLKRGGDQRKARCINIEWVQVFKE